MQPAVGNRLVSYPAPRIAAEPVSREHFIRRPRRRLVKRGVDLSDAIGFPPSALCIDWIEVEQFAPLNFLCVPLWSQQSRSAPINFGIGNPDSMNCEAPLVNARGIKQIKGGVFS